MYDGTKVQQFSTATKQVSSVKLHKDFSRLFTGLTMVSFSKIYGHHHHTGRSERESMADLISGDTLRNIQEERGEDHREYEEVEDRD